MKFKDRTDAGKQLAEELQDYKNEDVVVYALPRGGVEIGAITANSLNAPFDLLIARKIGHPNWAEYAVGAVTESGEPVWNKAETRAIDEEWLQAAVKEQREEAKRRRDAYLKDYPQIDPANKTAIITDDGVATGLTLMAAIKDLRQKNPEKIVVAAPVASFDVATNLEQYADEVVILQAPRFGFGAVGAYYEKFDQVSDKTVKQIMSEFKK